MKWLRISFRTGAVVDGIAAAAMFDQAIFARVSPLSGYVPETPYRYAMLIAGSLMLGWTVLLLWADRDPVARRGVLLITGLVILGLVGGGAYAAAAGFMSISAAVSLIALQVGLIALFTASYVASLRTPGAGP